MKSKISASSYFQSLLNTFVVGNFKKDLKENRKFL